MYPHVCVVVSGSSVTVQLINHSYHQENLKKKPPKDNQDRVAKPEPHTKYQGAGFQTH